MKTKKEIINFIESNKKDGVSVKFVEKGKDMDDKNLARYEEAVRLVNLILKGILPEELEYETCLNDCDIQERLEYGYTHYELTRMFYFGQYKKGYNYMLNRSDNMAYYEVSTDDLLKILKKEDVPYINLVIQTVGEYFSIVGDEYEDYYDEEYIYYESEREDDDYEY